MWTTIIPDYEGWFWFYGDAYSKKIDREELYMIRVRKIRNGFVYIADGSFMENKRGFWMPANVPEQPKHLNNYYQEI